MEGSHDQSGGKDWDAVKASVRTEVGEQAYVHYLKSVEFVAGSAGRVVLSAPTNFHRSYVLKTFMPTIQRGYAAVRSPIPDIDLIVSDSPRMEVPSANGSAAEPTATPANAEATGWDGGLGGPLTPSYRFENFIVGKANEFAYAAARRVAESAHAEFNPLFLYGVPGVGKTHLMHAIAWDVRARFPDRRVLCMNGERFLNSFIHAIRYRETLAFKEQLRHADLLLIDDIHVIGGKESTQEEFFHTFNALVEAGKQLVLTADRAPLDLDGMGERVKSRLAWGLVAEIHPADYELRRNILQAKAEGMRTFFPSVQVPDKVLDFLAQRMVSSVRALEGGLRRIMANAELRQEEVTVDTAINTLADLLRASDRKISIDDIQKKVADFYNVRVTEMLSPRRARVIARPRQVAMYLSRELTSRSLPEIGRRFGGRDHTTVLHAVKKIEALRHVDHHLNEELTVLQRIIVG